MSSGVSSIASRPVGGRVTVEYTWQNLFFFFDIRLFL
jgi:hypothetical protein